LDSAEEEDFVEEFQFILLYATRAIQELPESDTSARSARTMTCVLSASKSNKKFILDILSKPSSDPLVPSLEVEVILVAQEAALSWPKDAKELAQRRPSNQLLSLKFLRKNLPRNKQLLSKFPRLS
jgi:hypothetical protein